MTFRQVSTRPDGRRDICPSLMIIDYVLLQFTLLQQVFFSNLQLIVN